MDARKTITLIILCFAAGFSLSAAAFLLFTRQGLTFVAAAASQSLPCRVVTASSIEGNLVSAAVFNDIEARELRDVPGACVRIQQLRVRVVWPGRFELAVKNGRVILETGEVVSFSGTLSGSRLAFNIYSGLLYTQSLRSALQTISPGFLNGINARLLSVDLKLSNTLNDARLTGAVAVEQASFRNFSAYDFPLRLDLSLRSHGGSRRWFGRIESAGGRFVSQFCRLAIEQASAEFNGDPAAIVYKAKGRSSIGDTRISVAFNGTQSKPDLQLSSQPPMAQERLMAMLVTGQSWQGTEAALTQGRVTPGLIKDFADFFLYGNSGESLEKKLGISGIALQYGKGEKGIEVHKTVTRSADVIYGVRKDTENETAGKMPLTTQTVGLEYKLTDAFSVEGKKEIRDKQSRLEEMKRPESVIQLKYKKAF